jgi:hypothetical protein
MSQVCRPCVSSSSLAAVRLCLPLTDRYTHTPPHTSCTVPGSWRRGGGGVPPALPPRCGATASPRRAMREPSVLVWEVAAKICIAQSVCSPIITKNSSQLPLPDPTPSARHRDLHHRAEEMRLVGVTGGIASGKSTMSNLFKDAGIPVTLFLR